MDLYRIYIGEKSIIRTLQQWIENVPTGTKGKEKKQTHIREAIKTCGNPNWDPQKTQSRQINVTTSSAAGSRESLKNLCPLVHFEANNTLKQKHGQTKHPDSGQLSPEKTSHTFTPEQLPPSTQHHNETDSNNGNSLHFLPVDAFRMRSEIFSERYRCLCSVPPRCFVVLYFYSGRKCRSSFFTTVSAIDIVDIVVAIK